MRDAEHNISVGSKIDAHERIAFPVTSGAVAEDDKRKLLSLDAWSVNIALRVVSTGLLDLVVAYGETQGLAYALADLGRHVAGLAAAFC